jgi:hypothetical protein
MPQVRSNDEGAGQEYLRAESFANLERNAQPEYHTKTQLHVYVIVMAQTVRRLVWVLRDPGILSTDFPKTRDEIPSEKAASRRPNPIPARIVS